MWQRQEIEAELFAGTLLLPSRLPRYTTLTALADLLAVPLACVHSWQAASLLARETALPAASSY